MESEAHFFFPGNGDDLCMGSLDWIFWVRRAPGSRLVRDRKVDEGLLEGKRKRLMDASVVYVHQPFPFKLMISTRLPPTRSTVAKILRHPAETQTLLTLKPWMCCMETAKLEMVDVHGSRSPPTISPKWVFCWIMMFVLLHIYYKGGNVHRVCASTETIKLQWKIEGLRGVLSGGSAGWGEVSGELELVFCLHRILIYIILLCKDIY